LSTGTIWNFNLSTFVLTASNGPPSRVFHTLRNVNTSFYSTCKGQVQNNVVLVLQNDATSGSVAIWSIISFAKALIIDSVVSNTTMQWAVISANSTNATVVAPFEPRSQPTRQCPHRLPRRAQATRDSTLHSPLR
jgi:hypothetical protein